MCKSLDELSEMPETEDCIPWTGAIASDGYGLHKSGYAHRHVYIEFIGDIPETHHVHHKCKNRRCVNPKHLQALSPSEHARLHIKNHNRNKCSKCLNRKSYGAYVVCKRCLQRSRRKDGGTLNYDEHICHESRGFTE